MLVMSRVVATLLCLVIACAHSPVARSPALEIEVDVDRTTYDGDRGVTGRVLVFVKSGTARFYREVEPLIEVQRADECETHHPVNGLAAEIALHPRPVIDIESGSWYGKYFHTIFLEDATNVPACMELIVRVTARNARDESVVAA